MTLPINTLAEEAGQLLKQHGLRLATAESCTGGGLSYWITSVPGSSDWLERGFVTYSNQAKIEMLGVSSHTIETFGAVSEETVREMAEGALHHSEADISIAITGVAGPAGGSPQKPVGMVWIAWASPRFTTKTQVYNFAGARQAVRTQAIEQALRELLNLLKTTFINSK